LLTKKSCLISSRPLESKINDPNPPLLGLVFTSSFILSSFPFQLFLLVVYLAISACQFWGFQLFRKSQLDAWSWNTQTRPTTPISPMLFNLLAATPDSSGVFARAAGCQKPAAKRKHRQSGKSRAHGKRPGAGRKVAAARLRRERGPS